nr:mrna degradation protein, mitochondrial [Quercus suber]
MFRPVIQHPSWYTCTYVCHHCRRSVAAAKKHSQRHRSTSTSTSAERPSADGGKENLYDDWMDNFNDIGAIRQVQRTDANDSAVSSIGPGLAARPRVKAEAYGSGRTPQAPEREEKQSASSPQGYRNHHNNTSGLRSNTAHSKPVNSLLVDKAKSNPLSPRMRAQLHGLVASIRSEKVGRESCSRYNVAGAALQDIHAEDDSASMTRLPNPFERPSSRDASRLVSATRASSQETQGMHRIDTAASSRDEPDTTFLDSLEPVRKRLSPSRSSSFGVCRSLHPLLSKAQQTNERAAWGASVGLSPSNGGADTASYDTLRNADRLSAPDPINPRQSDMKTWGDKSSVDVFSQRFRIPNVPGFSQHPIEQTLQESAQPKLPEHNDGHPTATEQSSTIDASGRPKWEDEPPSKILQAALSSSHITCESGETDVLVQDASKDRDDMSYLEKSGDFPPQSSHHAQEASPSIVLPAGNENGMHYQQAAEESVPASSDCDLDQTGPHTSLPNLDQGRPAGRHASQISEAENDSDYVATSTEAKIWTSTEISNVATSQVQGRKRRQRARTIKLREPRMMHADTLLDRQQNHYSVNAAADRYRSASALGSPEVLASNSDLAANPGYPQKMVSPNQSVISGVDEIQPEVGPVADTDIEHVDARDLQIKPIEVAQPAIPRLAYGLDRVLFNPGVYQLQDPHSRVYNFDAYLQKIMPVADFDFNALKEYKTSSQDSMLSDLAREHGKTYVGSTSSMTSTLSHFHFLLSNFRDLNLNMMSKAFPDNSPSLTRLNRAPTAMFLRWQNGTYAIDADKEFDSGNVLMMLGKSMELLLTRSQSEYERYRKSDPREVSKEDREGPEAYQYTTMGDFLMRSQLDAHDPRLPGTGTFDLKTRAVVSVRMDAEDYVPMTGYEIYTAQGRWNSYEREYYDMIRSTMLKYSLQARMGRMDGIFVAYHNVTRIFGFQYISINEMDRALHGQVDRCLGDQEFKISIDLYNKVLNMASEKFPKTSLRFFFETRPGRADRPASMTIFAEPMEEPEIDRIQASSKERIAEFERTMMGKEATEKAAADTCASKAAHIEPASPTYTNTETAADSSFISHIETSHAATHRPLFCATIVLYNYTKLKTEPETAWQYCEGNRPTDLTTDQEWRVEYILKEPPEEMSESTRWAMYEDMKHRRKEAYWKGKEDGEEETVDSVSAKKEGGDYFKDLLRSMSEKDADVRKKLDQIEEADEKVVFGMSDSGPTISRKLAMRGGVPAAKTASVPDIVGNVESVDEYVQLLYGR